MTAWRQPRKQTTISQLMTYYESRQWPPCFSKKGGARRKQKSKYSHDHILTTMSTCDLRSFDPKSTSFSVAMLHQSVIKRSVWSCCFWNFSCFKISAMFAENFSKKNSPCHQASRVLFCTWDNSKHVMDDDRKFTEMTSSLCTLWPLADENTAEC